MNLLQKKIKTNLIFLIFGDFVIIFSSLFLSVLFRFEFVIPPQYLELLALKNLFMILSLKIAFFTIFGLYRGMWRFTSIWDLFNIIKSNIFSTLCLVIVVGYLYGFNSISRSLFIIDFMICVALISASRIGIRIFFFTYLNFF